MIDNFEKIKSSVGIEAVVTKYGVELQRNNTAHCPFHEDSKPSFSINTKENYFKCFGCDAKGSIIDFVSLKFGLSPLDAMKKISEDFGIELDRDVQTASKVAMLPKKKEVVVCENNIETIKAYINDCKYNICKTDYFQKRGLTQETIEKFCLGYDEKTNSVVIPYNKQFTYYSTRNVSKKEFYKPKTEFAGEEPLFNGLLIKKEEPIFVVESPICAMSINQCGGNAIALCGLTLSKLEQALIKAERISPLIISLDNDKAGKDATGKLCAILNKIDIPYICFNVASDCKDPNELLMKNPTLLTDNVATAIESAKKQRTRLGYKKSVDVSDVMSMELPEIEWVVEDLFPVGLQLLAAPSKYGKSWMMLQLAINVTKGGYFLGKKSNKADVLYLALEDNLLRLKSRMKHLLQGKKMDSGLHVKLSSGNIENGLFEELANELQTYPNIKLIIIDTLQFIRGNAGRNEGVYATDCREMKLIKQFADSNNVCVLLIHHLRKMTAEDSFNRISGSNGIMGTCDNTYIMTKDKRSDELTAFEITGRDVCYNTYMIRQNAVTSEWEMVADAETETKNRERELYLQNPIVRGLKVLLSETPSGLYLKMDELLVLIANRIGTPLAHSPSTLAKAIKELDSLLAVDGIIHTPPSSGGRKGRVHTFVLAEKQAVQQEIEDCYPIYEDYPVYEEYPIYE